jgi:hypothetical protein
LQLSVVHINEKYNIAVPMEQPAASDDIEQLIAPMEQAIYCSYGAGQLFYESDEPQVLHGYDSDSAHSMHELTDSSCSHEDDVWTLAEIAPMERPIVPME